MQEIPVTFTHEGKQYKGYLSSVAGAGGRTWHLMVDGYYWGQLLFVEKGFVFYAQTNTEAMLYLGEYFGEVVTGWYG